MPELPEVEVTRLSFADQITGAKILSVRIGKPLRWPLGCQPGTLVGQHILGVRRRGKYLLIDLQQGVLLMHLGMSGSLTFREHNNAMGKHDHFDLETTQGVLRLNDPRRFGAVVFAPDEQSPPAQKLLGRLGVEPLGEEFSLAEFQGALKLRKAPIKQVLLAGEVVVGVGNIYASEALFLAGIRPTTRAQRLSRPRVARLREAIRSVLARAVEKGGSTLKDFSNAHGESGYFQLEAAVYARQGENCRVCATKIRMIRQGQRATFYCPTCQNP
jgi:formamidopyrimidine-DNA glycosylase